MLHRFPSGVAGEKVHQKRVPGGAPPWLETVRLHFPRYGRYADELCVTELAAVIWAVQMSTVEFHPWNSRRADTERPDEWRIDLDPMPRCEFATVRRAAHIAHEILSELGITGWPKTSGGNGLHIYVRIEPRWGFADVRRPARVHHRHRARPLRRARRPAPGHRRLHLFPGHPAGMGRTRRARLGHVLRPVTGRPATSQARSPGHPVAPIRATAQAVSAPPQF